MECVYKKQFFLKSVLCFVFVHLGVESSKVVESQLGDFLVFLRRVLSVKVLKKLSTFVKWIDPLMTIISHKCSLGKTVSKHGKTANFYQILAVYSYFPFSAPLSFLGSPCFQNLRTKLLAFHVLERVLPASSDPGQIQQV